MLNEDWRGPTNQAGSEQGSGLGIFCTLKQTETTFTAIYLFQERSCLFQQDNVKPLSAQHGHAIKNSAGAMKDLWKCRTLYETLKFNLSIRFLHLGTLSHYYTCIKDGSDEKNMYYGIIKFFYFIKHYCMPPWFEYLFIYSIYFKCGYQCTKKPCKPHQNKRRISSCQKQHAAGA